MQRIARLSNHLPFSLAAPAATAAVAVPPPPGAVEELRQEGSVAVAGRSRWALLARPDPAAPCKVASLSALTPDQVSTCRRCPAANLATLPPLPPPPPLPPLRTAAAMTASNPARPPARPPACPG